MLLLLVLFFITNSCEILEQNVLLWTMNFDRWCGSHIFVSAHLFSFNAFCIKWSAFILFFNVTKFYLIAKRLHLLKAFHSNAPTRKVSYNVPLNFTYNFVFIVFCFPCFIDQSICAYPRFLSHMFLSCAVTWDPVKVPFVLSLIVLPSSVMVDRAVRLVLGVCEFMCVLWRDLTLFCW